MSHRVAVIGAGLAGAACARQLADADWQVELFDKGRGPGGRLSSRRAETPLGELTFDHGAQYLTTQSESFSAKVRAWMVKGVAESWTARLVKLDDRGLTRPITALAWVGRPRMSAIVAAELDGQVAWFGTEITSVIGTPGAWRLVDLDGVEHGFYEAVVVATPAEQAIPLLSDLEPRFADRARTVRTAPCWALMAAFDEPLDAPFDGAEIARGPLSWVARNSSKPGRGEAETWVVHAAPGWSREHLEVPKEEAVGALTEAFLRRVRGPDPVWTAAHLWRYAMVTRIAATPFLWDERQKVGACGDWLLGARGELAWRSGDELGAAMIDGATDP